MVVEVSYCFEPIDDLKSRSTRRHSGSSIKGLASRMFAGSFLAEGFPTLVGALPVLVEMEGFEPSSPEFRSCGFTQGRLPIIPVFGR